MLKPENRTDKERFEKLKDTELKHGREKQEATDVAARQVKELRKAEGRSKEENG